MLENICEKHKIFTLILGVETHVVRTLQGSYACESEPMSSGKSVLIELERMHAWGAMLN